MLTDTSLVLISLILVPLLAGIIHSAIGFGFGIVAIAFLPIVIDAKTAHIIISVCSVPMLLSAAWAYRQGCNRTTLITASLSAIIALPFGLLFFESISLDLLVRLTGLGVFLMVLSSMKGNDTSEHKAKTNSLDLHCFSAGLIAGFLAGAVSIAGPPIAAFAIRQNWKINQYKAFVTQFLLVIATCKAALLGYRDHIDPEIALEIVIASSLSMLGVWIGQKVSKNIPTQKLKRLVAAMLIAVATLMLIRGNPG